jgi:hypothetical protein
MRVLRLTAMSVLATSMLTALATMASTCRAQEMPEMPAPGKEHKLLEQFAGEWTVESTANIPGSDEPMTCTGTESSKLMGGFWFVADGEGDMGGMKMTSLMTIGYDTKAKQYVGTFVCSAGDTMWEYTGKFDETGKKLILSTTGPAMMDPDAMVEYEETLELVDADHKTFTSSVKGDDGKWTEIVKMEYTRVK